ncbi:hypothetical protein CDAR_426871 [Caerostris darwini]|uniref:Uncharacterized protein n=1 Tax=Caerostris darwini TaxID=1538125 RepID=A0AAV4R903_9ARAC|nr:hypothetical protein CDAR_426871 [Caerostris darwini]
MFQLLREGCSPPDSIRSGISGEFNFRAPTPSLCGEKGGGSESSRRKDKGKGGHCWNKGILIGPAHLDKQYNFSPGNAHSNTNYFDIPSWLNWYYDSDQLNTLAYCMAYYHLKSTSSASASIENVEEPISRLEYHLGLCYSFFAFTFILPFPGW